MRGSIKLFSIKGIDVKVHFTFPLILIWAAYHWGVQAGQGATGALFGVVVTVLLFACVTLHELAHSLTAMRYGRQCERSPYSPSAAWRRWRRYRRSQPRNL